MAGKSYAEIEMDKLLVTEENNHIDHVYHPETHVRSTREFVSNKTKRFVVVNEDHLKHELKGASGVKPGDLMINFFDLYGHPYKYKRVNSKKATKYYFTVRLQDPIKVDGDDKKYHLPYGADTTRPYIPNGIIEKFNKAAKWKIDSYRQKDEDIPKKNPGRIETLVLTEGAKKAWYADVLGMDIIGFNSITHYKNKTTGTMHPEILDVIEACDVDNVIMLYDGDCKNISLNAFNEEKDISKRPLSFFNSMRSIKNLLQHVIDERNGAFRLYFSAIKSDEIEGGPKGLDDLLMSFESNKDKVNAISDLVNLNKKCILYDRLDVTNHVGKLQRYLSINNVETFAETHADIIKQRPFKFRGSNWKWDDSQESGGRWVVVVPRDAKRYLRIGDDYHERVTKPNVDGTLSEVIERRSKATIRDDHGKDIFEHIEKYPTFCIHPSHVDYQQIVHNCYNLYYPFDHTPAEQAEPEDYEHITALFKHIFQDHYEIGLDYVQILYQKPHEKLPILILVSEEQGTGKSTFFFLLKDLFTNNMAVVGNEDLSNDFNGHWTSKLIVGCEETFIDKKHVIEKVKGLSTGKKVMMNKKGQDQMEVDAFMKFVFCSNNEKTILSMGESDTRYFVVKVPKIQGDKIHDLDVKLREEIPFFLNFLSTRKLSVQKEDRMWFKPERFRTKAFDEIVRHSMPQVIKKFMQDMKDLFEATTEHELRMDLATIKKQFFGRSPNIQNYYIKQELEKYTTAELYTEFYSEKTWYKNENDIPSGQSYELKSKSIRFKYPELTQTDAVQDSEASSEISIKWISKVGRPYVFKAEDFLDDEEYLAVFKAPKGERKNVNQIMENDDVPY